MKKSIPLFLMLLSVHVYCQKLKIHSYYDRFWSRVDADNAMYYRVVDKENGKYHVKDYYMSGALQSEIICIGITPKLQFDSELTLYYENGKPSQIGHFKDEKPYGVHQYFFENGDRRKEVDYQDGKIYFHQVWNNEGAPLLTTGSGSIEDVNEIYGNVYTIVKDSLAHIIYYKSGADTIFIKAEKQPEYRGGDEVMRTDLHANLTYPKSARRNNVEGRVYVQFIVSKTGEVKNCSILRGIDSDVDAAALHGVSMLHSWIPGTWNNKPIDASYIIPIRFNLKGWWFW